MNTKRLFAVVLAVALLYGAIALLGDVRALRATLSGFAWWTFAAALALSLGNYFLRFFKWEFYLRLLGIRDVPLAESFCIYVAGFSMSVTPAKAGEVFKSALLASARGYPIARTAPIVIADRLTDLISLIAMVALGGLLFPGGWIVALAASALVVGLMLFVLVRPLGDWAIALTERFALGRKLAPKVRDAYDALRILASPKALLLPTAISVFAWALEALGLWVILLGLGAPVSLSLASFVYATSTLAGAVAMLPGGVGGAEITMISLLVALSHGAILTPAAKAGTLLCRLATLWFAVVLGGLALAWFRRSYDRHRDEATPYGDAASSGPSSSSPSSSAGSAVSTSS
ncbi:MAG: Integral rane protein [Myxococcaceae bacterium]|nr:Integral rane protein [Myxococcaceae bacterium]